MRLGDECISRVTGGEDTYVSATHAFEFDVVLDGLFEQHGVGRVDATLFRN